MLVATIAATATYKWLTSEGRSSASRLLRQEAYQSAVAGIENTRAWMTFHANDVGALIKQYLDDNSHKPINLDGRLRSLTRAGQNYHVWLTGVNTEASTYKLKILSSGESGNNTRHSEIAIFNVDGLYRVRVPMQMTSGGPDFEYAYFGGSYTGAGNLTVSSAVVNGNWTGNPQNVTKNFIVTGNATLSGNNVNIGNLACIGGNLSPENNGLTGKDLYVGGNFLGNFTMSGDVYFNGDAATNEGGNSSVAGSMTVNGHFSQHYNKPFTISKNLCTTENGVIVSRSRGDAGDKPFTVEGDVWMPGGVNVWNGDFSATGCMCNSTSYTYTCTYKECECVEEHVISWWDDAVGGPLKEETTITCSEDSPNQGDQYDNGTRTIISKTCTVHDYGSCTLAQNGTVVDGKKLTISSTTAHTSQVACDYGSDNIVSCESYTLSNGRDNYSDYDRIVLGSKNTSKVYIKSARRKANYESLVDRSFLGGQADRKETGKAYCPTDTRFMINNSINWNKPGSHFVKKDATEYRVCGELSSNTSDTRTYAYNCGMWGGYGACNSEFVDYNFGWVNWSVINNGSDEPAIFIEKTGLDDDKYFIFNANDDFLRFKKEYSLNDWRVFSDISHMGNVKTSGWDFAVPIDMGHTINFDAHFATSAKIGAYVFKNGASEIPYYNQNTGTNTFYNYENSSITGTPYCYNNEGDYGQYRPTCGVTPWFKSVGTVESTQGKTPIKCAEDVPPKCEEIWDPAPQAGCDGSNYKVNDALVTAYDSFLPYANYGCASTIKNYSTDLVTKLNTCYSQLSQDAAKARDSLYNGFLVVNVSGSTNSTNPSGTLNGKFIIIVDGAIYTTLPQTTSDSYVFLYLKDGATALNDATVSNYFIYTLGNIASGLQFNLTGTIYASAETCAGIGALQSSSLTYSQKVVDVMSGANILCESQPCGGVKTGDDDDDDDDDDELEIGSAGSDSYYISMAPQLSVKVASQYTNDEPVPSGANQTSLNPSFIILPRVIYLPQDPFGEFTDYYNVVPLNGSVLSKSDVTITGCTAIPKTGKMYSSGSSLAEGVYTCEATASGYSKVAFWVVVDGTQRGTPQIHFVESDANQEMPSSGNGVVRAYIPAHDQTITVSTICPTAPTGWNYTVSNGGSQSGNTCTWTINPSNESNPTFELFSVTTTNATDGTLTFHLQAGEGYTLTSPYSASLVVSNSAFVNRIEATQSEIEAYCDEEAHAAECPEEGARSSEKWPSCATTSVWVHPSVNHNQRVKNSSWSILAGGSGTLKLVKQDGFNDCIVIIPSTGVNTSYSMSEIAAGETYSLKATAKAKKRSFKVAFSGNVGDNNNPKIHVVVGTGTGARTTDCEYDNVKNTATKSCTIAAFSGENVRVSIDRTNLSNENFRYWKCNNNGGTTCPTTETITGSSFGTTGFTLKDNAAVVTAHFGESDPYCFFDEFKSNTLECSGSIEYCIDKCGSSANSVCSGVTDANATASSKWHLVSGKFSDIVLENGYIHVAKTLNKGKKESDRSAVRVMNTAHAGINGTLKALISVPHATSSYGETSAGISQSGFLLHANTNGSEYLMLNLYENTSGKLAARLCVDGNTSSCVSGELAPAVYVSSGNMYMTEMAFANNGKLKVSAYLGNYYGTPDKSEIELNLSSLSKDYSSRDREYVGFSMADPNFKIFGIGWYSLDYEARCHDTYPTVKCSFAAVADNGVIPLETDVEPWVGHSGWFDSKSCTPVYYYNGSDACVSGTCSNFSFAESGAGAHGYTNNGTEVKTAKAWLACYGTDDKAVAWSKDPEDHRAHCGAFWTGKLTECTEHKPLVLESQSLAVSPAENNISFTSAVNLRGATLNIEMQNSDAAEVEVWLYSENEDWGANAINSTSVKMTGSSANFDVARTFAANAEGFDPEHVAGIAFKNYGTQAITLNAVTSTCGNAINLTSCTANYNETNGLNRWEITAVVTNRDKITSYTFEGTASGESVFSTTVSKTDENLSFDSDETKVIFYKSDNPYLHQGESYAITTTVSNGGTPKSVSCTVTPTTIGTTSCSNLTVNDVSSEAPWPEFGFTLSGCPNGSCDYQVLLDDDLPEDNCGNGTVSCSGSGSGDITKTAHGNAERCTTTGGCSHSYTVESTSADKPFSPCTKTFKVRKAVENPIGLTCPAAQTGVSTGSSVTISPTTTGCSSNCSYTITGDAAPSDGTESGTSFSNSGTITFTGSSTAGKKTYTLTMSRTGVESESCTFDVTYVVPVSFGVVCNIAAQTNVTQGATVSIEPEEVTGCENSNCSYDITLNSESIFDDPQTGYGGTDYSISFTGANSAGEKQYTLTISDGTDSEDCTFNVTYAASGSSGTTATCYFDPTSTYLGYTNNGCAASFKADHFSGEARDVEVHLYNGSNEISLCDNPPCKHYSTNTFTYCITTAFSGKGSVTYALKDGSGNNICDPQTLTVAVPVAACSVTPNPVTVNNPVTFSVPTTGWTPAAMNYTGLKLYYDGGASSIKDWSSIYGNNAISHSVTPTSTGTKTFTLKGFNPEETLCEVSVTVNSASSTGGGEKSLTSEGMTKYSTGTYTLKTGTLGNGVAPTTFKCRTENDRPSYARTIGAIKENNTTKHNVEIAAYNDYSPGYDLESNKTYTFVVTSTLTNLECGLWY